MTVDQYPLGSSGINPTGNPEGGIDPNVVHDHDVNYGHSRFGRVWFVYYSAGRWWHEKPSWVRTLIYMVPIVILLLIILLMAIGYSVALKRAASSSFCTTAECVQAAGRIIRNMNISQDPCFNFYEYACGGFAMKEEIPIASKITTQFTKREAILLRQLKKAIEKPMSADDDVISRVRTYYKSCLDTIGIEVKGLPKLQQMVKDLGGLYVYDNATFDTNSWSFKAALTRRSWYTMRGIFQVGVSPDYFDNSKNVIILDRGKLGLGANTRDFYLDKSLKDDPVLKAYIDMLTSYAQLISGSRPINREDIVDVVALEQKLAGIHSTVKVRRDVDALYREVKLEELNRNASYVKWNEFLTGLFKGVGLDTTIGVDETVVVLDLPYLNSLGGVLDHYTTTSSGIRTLQNYMTLLAVTTYAPRMGFFFRRAYARFAQVYSGNRGEPEPWLDCLADTNDKLAFPLGKMYLERFSPATQKPRAMNVADDVKKSYRQLIANAVWMDEKSRTNVLAKLDGLEYDVAYPEWLKDTSYVVKHYLDFPIADDYTANLFSYYNHSIRRSLRQYHRQPDADKWDLAPQTVNGKYKMSENKLYVGAALIHEPFFNHDEGMPDVLNYGSFGSMVGHEIGHAFDDKGQAFDAKGNIKTMWTKTTLAKFRNHTKCFVNQYNAYTIDSNRIDGEQTLGENIADSSGLRAGFAAYQMAKADGRIRTDAKLPGLDLNSDQLFFLSYAQTYCTLLTKQALRNQVLESSHSPAAVRVVGTLASSEDFARAYKCSAVTKMNRKEKCYLW